MIPYALALVFVAAPVAAQWAAFQNGQGMTAGLARQATNPMTPTTPTATLYAQTDVLFGSREYAWTTWSVLNNWADDGENVAVYGQAYKHGRGPTWAGVFEAQCPASRGACYATEIDLMASGAANPIDGRSAVFVVLGKARGAEPGPAEIPRAIHIIPFGMDASSVRMGTALDVEVPCADACIKLPPNACIQFGSRDFQICADDATGFVGFKSAGRWVWSVNMTTGLVRQ